MSPLLLKRADAEQQTNPTWLQGHNHVVAYEHHEGGRLAYVACDSWRAQNENCLNRVSWMSSYD